MPVPFYTDDTFCRNGLTYGENRKRIELAEKITGATGLDHIDLSSADVLRDARIEKILSAQANWVRRYANTHKVYLLTFMFKEMNCSERTRLLRMQDEIKRIYATLLTNVCWKTSGNVNPLWLVAAPDKPVRKDKKKKIPKQDLKLNDGLHYHAMSLVPRDSKLKTGLKRHFERYERRYIRPDRPLLRIDVKRIKRGDIKRTTKYALKGIARWEFSSDDLLVLT